MTRGGILFPTLTHTLVDGTLKIGKDGKTAVHEGGLCVNIDKAYFFKHAQWIQTAVDKMVVILHVGYLSYALIGNDETNEFGIIIARLTERSRIGAFGAMYVGREENVE